ncbi:aldo/keto reductase [Butyrivibrio sp. MC2013]|uniref:aldo/keto reductase n=1 Tax=Butyrivibrio sp. MC2013 TaxID=1280686 RepID=UPI000401319B|nr:aldo/keto reductase [Butyrivibrio sp. MC2013]
MQYRENKKNGDKLSALGYGCMRFSKKGTAIDQEKSEKEMYEAYQNGVNYYDTAYIYPGSEVCLGRFLAKYGIRDKVNIATKLPHYLIKKPGDIDKFFDEELQRLQTDYIDYYLMHMLNDANTWQRLCEMGVKDWLEQKKASGRIRNVGFSFHGGTVPFKALIDAYDWDFCQIQFNYMDEHSQAGIEGLRYAAARDIPVVIMEPLRGGRLANLPEGARREFEKVDPDRTNVDWGLRWIWNHPEVTVVLSGMNDIRQVSENVRTASEAMPGSLSETELDAYKKVLAVLEKSIKVGCTGCGYCQPCPKGVDIPTNFAIYNQSYTDGFINAMREYIMCTSLRKVQTNASLCVKCGKCEQHCPQHLEIRKELENVKKRMENPIYKIAVPIAKKILNY